MTAFTDMPEGSTITLISDAIDDTRVTASAKEIDSLN